MPKNLVKYRYVTFLPLKYISLTLLKDIVDSHLDCAETGMCRIYVCVIVV